jgi:disulfide bond formation protein DsbB
MALALSNDRTSAAYRWGALTLLAALAGILIALAFEYIGGMAPCPLCLQQRYAYYAGIPVLFFGLVLMASGWTRLGGALFLAVAVAFLANAGLGTYHAGAEWKFWPGPDTCAAPSTGIVRGKSLLQDLQNTRVVRCDEAAGRFAGLSFAGWNVILSIALCIGALRAAVAALSAKA